MDKKTKDNMTDLVEMAEAQDKTPLPENMQDGQVTDKDGDVITLNH